MVQTPVILLFFSFDPSYMYARHTDIAMRVAEVFAPVTLTEKSLAEATSAATHVGALPG